MQVGIHSGRNKLSHIKDFKLKCTLLCHFIVNRFVKNTRTYKAVDIDIHLKRMAENEQGMTYPDGMEMDLPISKINKNKIKIYINSLLLDDEYNFLRTLTHELVHAKQYILGELSYKKVGMVWKGIPTGFKFGDDMNWLDYYDYEWEIEAFGREEGLMVMFDLFYKEWQKQTNRIK
jgi:hypothetical protein